MTDVGKICEDQIRNEEKYDRWERLLKRTEMDFAGCRAKICPEPAAGRKSR